MKALVTGGCGFLGSHIAEALLAAGHAVTVLRRRPDPGVLTAETARRVRFVTGDVRDEATLRQAMEGCAWVFHCAALVGAEAYARQPVETMETETRALQAVCRAALAAGVGKVFYPSSSAVYGDRADDAPHREDESVAPVSSYAIAKRYNELYLEAQHQENGLSSVALRIFNVYGPRQDARLVIPRFIQKAQSGVALEIFGDGRQTRDFVYVDDVARAALLCAEKVTGQETVNVALGRPHSVRDMAERILKATGSNAEIVHRPAPDFRRTVEVRHCVGDSTRLKALTGYAPETSLDQGLRRTVAWSRAQGAGVETAR